MGMLSRLIESHVETRDHHPEPRLKTRYFKTTKLKLLNACREWIEQERFLTRLDQSEERGEIAVQVSGKRKGLLVITIISVNPIRTAVDVSFTVDRGLNLGYGQALCDLLYERLASAFEQVS